MECRTNTIASVGANQNNALGKYSWEKMQLHSGRPVYFMFCL